MIKKKKKVHPAPTPATLALALDLVRHKARKQLPNRVKVPLCRWNGCCRTQFLREELHRIFLRVKHRTWWFIGHCSEARKRTSITTHILTWAPGRMRCVRWDWNVLTYWVWRREEMVRFVLKQPHFRNLGAVAYTGIVDSWIFSGKHQGVHLRERIWEQSA